MSNTFSELVRKVIILSNRPDTEEEIKIAVRDATLAIHRIEFFPRDLKSGVITNTKGRQTSTVVPISKFARLRGIANVTPFSGDYDNPKMYRGHMISPLTPNPSLSYCRCHSNWWTNIGGNLSIHSNAGTNQFYVEYYENPCVFPEESYDSWIADTYPDIVRDYALMLLFTTLRDPQASNTYASRVGTRAGTPTGHIATILMEQLQQQVTGA